MFKKSIFKISLFLSLFLLSPSLVVAESYDTFSLKALVSQGFEIKAFVPATSYLFLQKKNHLALCSIQTSENMREIEFGRMIEKTTQKFCVKIN